MASSTSELLGRPVVAITQIWIPLDFKRSSDRRDDNKNHTSTLDFPADVDAYLSEELKYGAILGPYAQCPIVACQGPRPRLYKKNQ